MKKPQSKSKQQKQIEKKERTKLSDVQKQQALLGSTRLLDHESFIKEFKSFEAPDSELIDDYCQHNNEKAFTYLYKRHKPKMLAYLYGILHNWPDAQDVYHNSWEVVLRHFRNKHYLEEDNFEGWFRLICRRQAKDWQRDTRRFFYGNDAIPDQADNAYSVMECIENRQSENLLHKALNRLTITERQVVILRIYRSMSFYEIAVIRHITASAARGMYCRAIGKMRQRMRGQ